MRFGIKYIWHPTPTKIKHAADALNGALGASGLVTVLADHTKTGIALAASAFVLKAVSNFFTHDEKNCDINHYDVR